MSKIKDFVIERQNKKAELQSNIERLLSEFKEETGVYVDSIIITDVDVTNFSHQSRILIQHVKVAVRLP
jgi:hypothetical protein